MFLICVEGGETGLELGAWREMGLGLVVLTEKQAGARQRESLKSLKGTQSLSEGGGRPLKGRREAAAAGDWRAARRGESGQPSRSHPGEEAGPDPGLRGEAEGQAGPRWHREGAQLPGLWLGQWEMVAPFLEVREHGRAWQV